MPTLVARPWLWLLEVSGEVSPALGDPCFAKNHILHVWPPSHELPNVDKSRQSLGSVDATVTMGLKGRGDPPCFPDHMSLPDSGLSLHRQGLGHYWGLFWPIQLDGSSESNLNCLWANVNNMVFPTI